MTDNEKYGSLKLSNQICFPLYAASKEIIRRYKPFLDGIDLTYTQYITMMVMWECGEISIKELGERLFLDSGTLTPVVKKLCEKGFVTKRRCDDDERSITVEVTEKGYALRDDALGVPAGMMSCVELTADDAAALYTLLYKLLGGLK